MDSDLDGSSGMEPMKTLNALGLFCPEPIFLTKVEMDKLAPGDTLEVLADDPAAEEDITRWARRTGQEVLELEKQSGRIRFLLRKAK